MTLNPRASKPNLRVLALEPYFGLSHRIFLEGYRRHSRHRVEIWDLSPRKWKWRMRASAIHFADRAARLEPLELPDVVLASDFLNLPDWLALAPAPLRGIPTVLYFHENQVTYPLAARAPADFHYGWVNLSSALAADRVLFNSRFHLEQFLEGVSTGLGNMPDHVPEDIPGRIRRRSSVFPVGIDFDPHREVRAAVARPTGVVPVLAWSHRWEEDKGPDLLADALLALKSDGVPFRLIVCGQSGPQAPPAIRRLSRGLGDDLLHAGFVPDRREYLSLLRRADGILSTARHEFFGVAVVEAMYLGCLPVLPRALSYPEILPAPLHDAFLYDGPAALPGFLRRFLAHPPAHLRGEVEACAERFDWRVLAPQLDSVIEETHAGGRR